MRRNQSAFLLTIATVLFLPAAARAQVVQQPQFNFTTAATTVLVPDRGEVILGGINRASDGRSQFGVPILGRAPVAGRPFNNTAISRDRSAGTLSVRAYIHDFEAMDEALLGQAAANRGGAPLDLSQRSRGPNRQPVLSVAEIERRRSAAEDEKRFDVANLLTKAKEAEAGGKPGLAKILYNMVAKQTKDAGERAMAQQRVAALTNTSSGTKLATNPR